MTSGILSMFASFAIRYDLYLKVSRLELQIIQVIDELLVLSEFCVKNMNRVA